MTLIDQDAAPRERRIFPPVADAQDPDVIPPFADSVTWRWARVVPVAVQRRGWAPATVIMVLAYIVLLGAYVQKSPCLHTNPGWSNGLQFRYGCYSDVIPLYGDEGLNRPGIFPYQYSWRDGQGTSSQQVHYTEYPVLTGVLMWANAKFTEGYRALASSLVWLPQSRDDIVFFDFCALFSAVFWLISVRCLTRMTQRRVWDGAIAALSPLVIVQAFTNYDMLAIAFATTGMLAWSRRRPALAGALIGLGAAAKLYPILLLIPMFALCVRAGKWKQWLAAAATAGACWAVVNAPIALLFPRGWSELFRLNSARPADTDSIYNVVAHFMGWGGFDGPLGAQQTPTRLNEFVAIALAACSLAIVTIGISAPRRPRIAQLAFLIVSAFLLVNKVWSPQYSLWLIPLAVLAVPRWKPLLAWMVVDAVQWIPRMRFYQGIPGGWPVTPLLDMIVVRDLAVVALCGLVIYEIYHPERDLVRRAGDDDPAGGVLDGAPDTFTLRPGARRRVAPQKPRGLGSTCS